MRCRPPCLLPCGARISGETPFSRLSGACRMCPRSHCRRVWCLRLGHGIRARFVARRSGRSPGLWSLLFGFGMPSVGGDWPGLADGDDQPVATRKMDKERPCRSDASPVFAQDRSGGSRRNSSPAGSASDGFEQFPPAFVDDAPGVARSRKVLPARLRHCRRRRGDLPAHGIRTAIGGCRPGARPGSRVLILAVRRSDGCLAVRLVIGRVSPGGSAGLSFVVATERG